MYKEISHTECNVYSNIFSTCVAIELKSRNSCIDEVDLLDQTLLLDSIFKSFSLILLSGFMIIFYYNFSTKNKLKKYLKKNC